MRWNKKTPKYHETRIVKRFCWLPETYHDEEGNSTTIWLETIEVQQTYFSTSTGSSWWGSDRLVESEQ